MGLLKEFYNGAMAIPSTPKPVRPSISQAPVSTQPKKLDLRNGTYTDPSLFNPNFRYRVEQGLKGTLKDASKRAAVANIFYQSRGGRGIDKQEIKNGLLSAVKKGKLNENQMWAVRKKYGVF
ncbi:MAG TPA: hypothetical protein VF974_05710 [Patescibacteria group bacterium]